MLNPISLFSALAVFGSSGFILTEFSSLNGIATFLMAIALALLTLVCLYYLIVKPRDVSETSLSFSIKQLVGLKGIVSVPIPAHGFGEVIIKVGGGNSNQIAASFDNVDIKQDDPIFVVDEKEGVLYVSILII
jgi:membrane protein implicated in regulation of membrane protease activity